MFLGNTLPPCDSCMAVLQNFIYACMHPGAEELMSWRNAFAQWSSSCWTMRTGQRGADVEITTSWRMADEGVLFFHHTKLYLLLPSRVPWKFSPDGQKWLWRSTSSAFFCRLRNEGTWFTLICPGSQSCSLSDSYLSVLACSSFSSPSCSLRHGGALHWSLPGIGVEGFHLCAHRSAPT